MLDCIGNTPLIRLRRLTADLPPAVEVYIKAEWFNPGGSVKDRPVRAIIEDAERDGRLRPGRIILDASSGNAGIAYAMIGAAKGYPVHLVVPENVSAERKAILRAYGAEVRYSNPLEGSDGAILLARELARAAPDRYFYADQYNNPSNVRAHYTTTGPEVYAQTGGRITHFVAGLGTSGTIMGAGRYLRERTPGVTIVAVEPDSGLHGIEGLKHMATAIVPGIYDPAGHDLKVSVPTEAAYAMARRLAREEGILAGQSAGAAAVGALAVAHTLEAGVVVAIGPDGGDRYLSTAMWETSPQFASDDGFVTVEGRLGEGTSVSFRRRFCYKRRVDAVVLAAGHLAAVLSQALEEAPLECCGLLLGHGHRVERVFRGTNIDHSPVTYNMDPQELYRAHRLMEAEGLELTAIYHSHPRTRAYPSSTDIAKATYPDSFYLIVSLQDPSCPEVRVFRIVEGRVSEGTVIVA
ncbi:MAG: pyridoxal-phosphate dependent enzyme [Armatimonadota bacterium]|nr:pyridoxal-phosphate dependent enzyme [Armatimonadota bacterium]